MFGNIQRRLHDNSARDVSHAKVFTAGPFRYFTPHFPFSFPIFPFRICLFPCAFSLFPVNQLPRTSSHRPENASVFSREAINLFTADNRN